MQICKFSCGFCHKYTGTRKGLRKHLRENHVRNHLTNSESIDNKTKKFKQNWWIREEIINE